MSDKTAALDLGTDGCNLCKSYREAVVHDRFLWVPSATKAVLLLFAAMFISPVVAGYCLGSMITIGTCLAGTLAFTFFGTVVVLIVLERKTFYSFKDKDGKPHMHKQRPIKVGKTYYWYMPNDPTMPDVQRIPGPIAHWDLAGSTGAG